MSLVISILLTLLLLSVLVLVHEFGHFIVAKLMGIRVLEFSLFMGPKIFSVKKGDTVYSIRCIPIGGFCSMEGEESTSDDDKAYSNKAWYQKAAVVIAGPAMNIILALVLSIIMMFCSTYPSLQIGEVIPGSPAASAGVAMGDKVVALNGSGVSSYMELGVYQEMFPEEDGVQSFTIKKADGSKVTVEAGSETLAGFRTKVYAKGDRENGVYVAEVKEGSVAAEQGLQAEAKVIAVNDNPVSSVTGFAYYRDTTPMPRTYTFENPDGTQLSLVFEENTDMGVSLTGTEWDKRPGLLTMLSEAGEFTVSMVKVTVKSFVWLLTGTASAEDVTGPVGMVTVVNDTVASANTFGQGALMYLILSILISVNLGVFNIFPFPALDGGRLIFALIEGITRKKVKPEVEGIVSVIGMVILLGLSVLIMIKDVRSLF